MKRNSILFSILLVLFTLSLNAQIEIEEEVPVETDSPTQGFFVKGGSQKIDALECYTFKDLIIAFDLKKEHFNCDKIVIEILVESVGYFKYALNQDEFKSLFKDKEYAYFQIFPENLKGGSRWKSLHGRYLTRSKLQYATKKGNLQDVKMTAKIFLAEITGEKEVTEMQSSGELVTRKEYDWMWNESASFSIELKNRILLKRFKFLMNGYPEAPVATGNCYE